MAETKLDDPKYATKRSGVSKEDLHKEMMARHRDCRDFYRSPYKEAEGDMEFAFLPDNQWDDWMQESRKGRPMYTVNKVRQAMKQITNDQRQNRPQAKVRAVEGGDEELAEVRQGLMRNIDSASDADRARDTAFQFAVGGGFGVWRVTTGYEDDGGFDQVIKKEEIANPYSVTFDPSARNKDRRDAKYAFIDSMWTRRAVKERWPKAKMVSVGDTDQTNDYWFDEQEILLCEYYYKTAEAVEIALMSDGSVYDVDEKFQSVVDDLLVQGITEQRRRWVERTKVWHCIVSGAEILEGPNEWAGRFIPLVPVWGEILHIDGRDQFFGAVRFAKDAQRIYNYERSASIEMIADQGYSPYMATAAMLEGQTEQWQTMRTKRSPVLVYTVDPTAPNGGAPIRLPTPDFPAALANSAAISSDDIKASTGIHDASLGARSNETSGRAILARQREGDVANFDYIDNLSYALKYDYEITNDLISKIYDTERQVRIIGEDGAEKVVQVNRPVFDQQSGQWITLNDMSKGRFDIAVTIGPSYTTQRMEAAEALMQLANDPSPIGMMAKIGFLDALDAPGMDFVKKGARKWAVSQGLIEPEEGDQPPPPPQPNPKDIAAAEKDASNAALNAAKTQQIELANQEAATKFGFEMGTLGIPPAGGIMQNQPQFMQPDPNGFMQPPMQ